MEVVNQRHYNNSKKLVAKKIAEQWGEHMARREGGFIKVELQKETARFRVEVDWSCSFTRKNYDTIISFVLHEEYPHAKELAQEEKKFLEEALEGGTSLFLKAEDIECADISVSEVDRTEEEVYYFTLTVKKAAE